MQAAIPEAATATRLIRHEVEGRALSHKVGVWSRKVEGRKVIKSKTSCSMASWFSTL
jgi:hypothetical protein